MGDIDVVVAPPELFAGGPQPLPSRRRAVDADAPARKRRRTTARPPGALPARLWLYTLQDGGVDLHGVATIGRLHWRSPEVDASMRIHEYLATMGGGRSRAHQLVWEITDLCMLPDGPARVPVAASRSWTHIARLEAIPAISKLLLKSSFGLVYFAIRAEPELLPGLVRKDLKILLTPKNATLILHIPLPEPTPPQELPATQVDLAGRVASTTTLPSRWKNMEYAFTFKTIATGLLLRRKLANSHVDIGEVCGLVWDLSLSPPVAAHMHEARSQGDLKFPSRSVLNDAQLKFDVLLTAWHRSLMNTSSAFRYLIPDSSPQAGYDILCVLEDSMSWPRGWTPEQQCELEPASSLRRRVLPLSTLGYGASSAHHKACNIEHIMKLESGDHLERRRAEVRTIVSDQGGESALANIANMNLGDLSQVVNRVRDGVLRPADDDATAVGYMFPNAVFMPDHCHMIFGSCQDAFAKCDQWQAIEPALKELARLLRSRLVCDRFRQRCLPPQERARFGKKSFGYVDWKWEYMHRFLDGIIPVWGLLSTYFDKAKLCDAGDEASGINPQLVGRCQDLLRSSHVLGILQAARAVTKSLDSMGTWFEGCRCHEKCLEEMSIPIEERVQNYRKASAGCMMKGRRGDEAASGAIHMLLGKVSKSVAEDHRLQAWYVQASAQDRALIRSFEELVMAKLMERLRDKLRFWSSLPYNLLGLYHPDTGKAKVVARSILDEHKRAQNGGVEHKLHRVAKRVLGGDAGLYDDLVAFAHSHHPLVDFPRLFIEVRSYALTPLVSRRTEGLHAMVKASHSKAPRSLIPYLSARLRADELAAALVDQQASSFLEQQWALRGYMDRALVLVLPRTDRWQLKIRKHKWKVDIFYQCCLVTQFRDRKAAKAASVEWAALTKALTAPHAHMIDDVGRLFLTYWKDKFAFPGLVLSVPQELIQVAEGATVLPMRLADFPSLLRTAWLAAPDAIADERFESHFFFMVNNARPEQRRVVVMPHLPQSSSTIEVSVLHAHRRGTGRVVVEMSGRFMDLDLLHLARMDALCHVFAWQSVGRHLLPTLKASAVPMLTGDHNLTGGAETQMVPLDDGVLGVMAMGDNAVADESSAFAKRCADLVIELGLRQGDTTVFDLITQVPDLHPDHIDALLAAQHIVSTDDEFGEVCLRVNTNSSSEGTAWVYTLEKPRAIVCMPPANISSASKVDLLLYLFREGFEPIDSLPGGHTPSAPRVFVSGMVAHSRLYLVCVASSGMLWTLGIDQFLPGKPEEYYHCVLELPTQKLKDLHARADFHRLSNAQFRKVRRGADIPLLPQGALADVEAPAALADGAAAEAHSPDGFFAVEDDGLEGNEPPLAESAAVAEIGLVADIFRPATVRGVRVLFDYFSHSSGVQRGYIRCPTHGRCFRYVQCNQFASRRRLVAYLYAWQVLGPTLTRAAHQNRECRPDDRTVDAVEAEVEL